MKTTILLLALLGLAACGGPGRDGEPGSAGEGDTCTSTVDCGEDLICLSIGEATGTCALDCSVSADACGGSAECAGVGSLEVDVCQPPEAVADESGPPEEESRPSIPCETDEDCDVVYPGAVCGTWRGWKECTLTCTSDDTCNPPTMGGVTISFMTCSPDEGDDTRDICVPDEDCFANPMSCVDMGGGYF